LIKALKILVQAIWTASLIILGTTAGTLHGWEHHGWLGAIVLGTVGLGVGAFVACSPSLLFQNPGANVLKKALPVPLLALNADMTRTCRNRRD
jgi:uncharacterized membrane protein YeaQ/YmgE (transglycosylase-associated protein family)